MKSTPRVRARRAGLGLVALALLACDSDDAIVDVFNTPPEIEDQAVTTAKNTAVDVTLAGEDAEGDDLTFDIGTAPSNGTLSAFTDLSARSVRVTYTPSADFSGTDSFTYTADDGTDDAEPATVTITVENAVPVAQAVSLTTAKGTAVTITLQATDADDGETLSFAIAEGPENGTLGAVTPAAGAPSAAAALETTATATVQYTPATGFGGTDTFTYTVSDGTATSEPATVTVEIENETPVAQPRTATTTSGSAVDITLMGSDPDGDPVTFAIATQPENGTLGALGTPAGGQATITYTPDDGFTGTDTFTYTVTDGTETSAPATVTVTVTNQAPVANDISVTTPKNTAVEITLSGTDPEGEDLGFAIASQPDDGTLGALGSPGDGEATITYTPDDDFTGTDTFTYTVSDDAETSAPATVTITVSDTEPAADAGAASTTKNVEVTITLTGTDPDGDALTFGINSSPLNGSLGAIAGNGDDDSAMVVYTPNDGFVGSDAFTFTVSDGSSTSDPATVTVTVTNQAPEGDAQTVDTTQDTAVDITLTGTDADGDALTFAIAAGPANGSLSAITNPTPTSADVTYTPDSGFTGQDTFTFTVSDGSATSDPVTVTIDVS